jgi:transcriptional regulator with XRE-family HTH domain
VHDIEVRLDLLPVPSVGNLQVSDSSSRLGAELRLLRELRKDTLRDVASSADISAAYLLKLERGDVQSPSPHVLRRIADYFNVSYLNLMRAAGYDVTDTEDAAPRQGVLASALAADALTEAEQRAVAAFLTTLRAQSDAS